MQLEFDFHEPADAHFVPVNARWESAARWYRFAVEPDLFGNWVLTRMWGSRLSNRFRLLQEMPASPAEVDARLRTAERRRARPGTGYVRVS